MRTIQGDVNMEIKYEDGMLRVEQLSTILGCNIRDIDVSCADDIIRLGEDLRLKRTL